ncbi:MAG: hypothetical protein K2K03_05705, partial [Prevotella sp.]|nr:hypothetical protein [Prevotella sp.]
LNHQHARPTTVRTCCATHTEPLRTPSRACVYPSPRHSARCTERLRTVCEAYRHHAPTQYFLPLILLRIRKNAYLCNANNKSKGGATTGGYVSL